MANNASEFLLSLIGTLDEVKTKENIQNALNRIGKTVSLNSKGKKSNVQLFDRKALEEQGAKIIDISKNVEQEIRKMYKPLNGKIDISGIKDAMGQITQYTATVTKANQVVDRFVLKRMEFEGGGSAFVQTNGGFTDKGFGSVLTKQLNDLQKARADIDNLMTQFLTGNGSKVLTGDTRIEDIMGKLISAEEIINRLNANAGYNSREQMNGIVQLINGIKAEAEEYQKLEVVEAKQAKKKEQDDQKSIKITQEQSATLKKYKADVNGLLDTYIRVNGTKLLTKDKNSSDIQNRSVELLGDINKLSKTAGLNTSEQMEHIKDTIDLLKKEADEYYRIEKNQKSLIDSQTKEVEAVQNKVTALSNRYIDKSGSNQLFDTKNIEDVNTQISKIMSKVSELRANTGKASYNFDANLSVLNNMYDALEKNAKGYYKLETEQRKSITDYETQSKVISGLEAKLQSLKDKAFIGGSALKDAFNIEETRKSFKEVSSMIDKLKTDRGTNNVLAQGGLDAVDNKLKEIGQDISVFKDMENSAKQAASSVESQLNILTKYEEKVKNLKLDYLSANGKNTLGNEAHVQNLQNYMANLDGIIDRMKIFAKIDPSKNTEKEFRELLQVFNAVGRVTDEYHRIEVAQNKNDEALRKQTNDLNSYFNELTKINRTALNAKSGKGLIDSQNISEIKKQYNDLFFTVNNLKARTKAGEIIPTEELDKLSAKFEKIRQDITVFKDEESLQKSLAGNIESQLNALNTIENKIISIQSKMLDGNKITTPSYISDISNQTANALNTIETLRAKAGSITDTESRNLTNIVATLQREADEYARIDSVQQKSDESLRKQINTLADYKRGLNDIYNLNIDPSSNGALKNQDNINKISESIVRLKSELSSMQQISSSGQLIPVEQMDRYLALYKDLNSQVALARSQEGLDSRIAKDTQSQINKFAEMERALERFRAKYYGDGSSTKLSDQMHIDETVDKLNVLNNMMLIFKSNAGNITDEQINSYKNLENELNITADRYAKLEAIQKKETQTIDDQKYILDGYYLELKKIRETTLNPDSSLSLVNSNEFQKIFDSYSKFEEKYSSLRAINNSGSLINKGDIQETDLIIKELTQDIKILSQAERDREKNKIVQDGFAAQLNLDKERLKTFIQELQRDNLLTKEFRIEIGKLATALYHVKTPEALKNIERDMAALSEQAKRTRNDMQDSISGEQLQQKIRLLSAQVVGYMNQNTKAVGQFKSQFDALRNSINNITDANGLAKAQNEFKLLQQNINNAGQAGMTFGERMSAAVKKFLMWTGMTNVVMYFVRSIKQMITHTKELDSAMTFLKRVTNETDLTYRDMFDNAIKKAKELNSSVKDLINSTAEFAKLGFTSKQAEQLAEATTVYARVGQLDVGDATESIISTISGFKDLEASDVWKIVDEFDNIGNKFAISSGGIGEALKRSAASLSESNNSLEESIALITTANSVVKLCHLAIVI